MFKEVKNWRNWSVTEKVVALAIGFLALTHAIRIIVSVAKWIG